MQVITMVFWTVFDLIFTFFHMLFWGELDLIFTISSLKVIIVIFWIEFDFIVHLCLLLNAGDYHGVLDCVGLDIHLCLPSFCSELPEK